MLLFLTAFDLTVIVLGPIHKTSYIFGKMLEIRRKWLQTLFFVLGLLRFGFNKTINPRFYVLESFLKRLDFYGLSLTLQSVSLTLNETFYFLPILAIGSFCYFCYSFSNLIFSKYSRPKSSSTVISFSGSWVGTLSGITFLQRTSKPFLSQMALTHSWWFKKNICI